MNVIFSIFVVVVLVLVAFFGVWGLKLYTLFAVIIPYLAIIAFLAGFIYRIVKWGRSPVPFHIPTVSGQQKSLPWIKANKLESPSDTAGVVGRMALEILLFRSLFRNDKTEIKRSEKLIHGGDRWLWLGGLVFHWSLLGILFRHSRFFMEPVPSIVQLAQNIDGMFQIILPTLFITDLLILLGLVYLFVRRIIVPKWRYLSLPSDYFVLVLIGSVVLSGLFMRVFFHADLIGVKELAIGVITLHPSIPANIGLTFYIHLFLVCSLLAYFPFSKLMHSAGVFLSPTRNLMNNSRMRRHVNPWNYPVKLHTYEEYEKEFRDKMKKVGLPVEKE